MLYKDYLNNKHIYQEDGYRFLIERKHAGLFYKQGKGKTYPAIDALRDIVTDENVLILSTADSIKNMWRAEIEPQKILPKNTELMTFTSAIQAQTKLRLMRTRYKVIVVDECHKVKSHNSQISKLVYALTKKVEYAWGLTGTPRGNVDIDIFNIFHNLNISYFGDISYSRFVTECCDVEQMFFGSRRFERPIGINHRYEAGWQRNISMYTQRVDYAKEDNMPDLNIIPVQLPYKKSDEYKAAENGFIKVPEYSTTMTKLVAISKMHQAANGYLYLEDGKIHKFCRNSKLDWLLSNVTDRPTLIVYRHIADLHDLEKLYPSATENVNDFKAGKSKILLLQCSRCESFNLQMCNDIIFYTLDYSFIKYDQMLHRCWRMGQYEPVNIYILLHSPSIENSIWSTVKTKEKLANLFMSAKEDIVR